MNFEKPAPLRNANTLRDIPARNDEVYPCMEIILNCIVKRFNHH